jgi:hypothetical protein
VCSCQNNRPRRGLACARACVVCRAQGASCWRCRACSSGCRAAARASLRDAARATAPLFVSVPQCGAALLAGRAGVRARAAARVCVRVCVALPTCSPPRAVAGCFVCAFWRACTRPAVSKPAACRRWWRLGRQAGSPPSHERTGWPHTFCCFPAVCNSRCCVERGFKLRLTSLRR